MHILLPADAGHPSGIVAEGLPDREENGYEKNVKASVNPGSVAKKVKIPDKGRKRYET